LENKNINQQEKQEQVGGKPKDRVNKELDEVSEFLKKLVMSNIDEQLKREALNLLEKVSDIKSYMDWANSKLRFYAKMRNQRSGGAKKWQSKR
jgi:Na+/phosphate symporter